MDVPDSNSVVFLASWGADIGQVRSVAMVDKPIGGLVIDEKFRNGVPIAVPKYGGNLLNRTCLRFVELFPRQRRLLEGKGSWLIVLFRD